MPYIEIQVHMAHGDSISSFSSGAHLDERSHVKRLISLQVVVLDRLHLGRPEAAPAELRIGESLSSRQWSVVRRLEHLAFDGNAPEFVDAAAMGRVHGWQSWKLRRKPCCTLSCCGFCARLWKPVFLPLATSWWFPWRMRPSLAMWHSWRWGWHQGERECKTFGCGSLDFPKACIRPSPILWLQHCGALWQATLSRGVPVSEAGVPPKVQVRANLVEKLKLYLEPSDRVLVCSGEDLRLPVRCERGEQCFARGFEFGRGQVCLWRQFCMTLQQGEGGGGTFIPPYGRQMSL